MIQLEKVIDARKHTKRLARITQYHELVTAVEVEQLRGNLRKAFK